MLNNWRELHRLTYLLIQGPEPCSPEGESSVWPIQPSQGPPTQTFLTLHTTAMERWFKKWHWTGTYIPTSNLEASGHWPACSMWRVGNENRLTGDRPTGTLPFACVVVKFRQGNYLVRCRNVRSLLSCVSNNALLTYTFRPDATQLIWPKSPVLDLLPMGFVALTLSDFLLCSGNNDHSQ